MLDMLVGNTISQPSHLRQVMSVILAADKATGKCRKAQALVRTGSTILFQAAVLPEPSNT